KQVWKTRGRSDMWAVREIWRTPTGWRKVERCEPSASPEGQRKKFESVVRIQDLSTLKVRQEDPESMFTEFFPGVRNKKAASPFEVPLSEKFWHSYAEPLDEFLSVGLELLGAVRDIKECEPNGNFREAAQQLNCLTFHAHPRLERSGDRIRQRWACPSLLSSLA